MAPSPSSVALRVLGVLSIALLVGCSRKAESRPMPAEPPAAASAGTSVVASALADAPATTRRIIRTAELSLETQSPDATEAQVTALAESRDGFVISSDTARSRDDDGSENVNVTVVFRVPSPAFDATLEAVRALGTHVASEKVTGQDVTEEYVDLEARIRSQRAVEDQYMAVLKDAKSIPDVLAVQQKLGEVRTEIERAEGRRRYLESQTALSTFTVHLARHVAAVEASGPGFGASVRRAGRDAVEVTVAIINGAIRVAGVLLPIGVLIILPGFYALRWLVRRRRRAIERATS